MSVINTFHMLFKSDTKQAQADIIALDKKLETLRAKGKKRTDEERKETYELTKQRKEMNKELEGTANQTQKVIESATQAAAAYVSFAAIKSGILDAQKFNRELTIQTDLWQQNASEVNAYASAVKSAGGNAQAALGWYQGIRDQNASVGLQTMDFSKLMDRIHNQVKGLSQANAQLVFGQYGISDKGQQSLLMKGDADYQKEIARQQKIASSTAAGAKSSQEFGKAVDDLDSAMTALWTTINSEVLPAITPLIRGLADFATTLSNNKEGAMAFFAIVTAGATGLAVNSARILLGFTGLRGGLLALAQPLASVVGIIARFLGLIGIGIGAYQVGAGVADVVHGTRKSWIGRQSQKVAGWFDSDIRRQNAAVAAYKGGGSGAPGDDGSSAMQYLMDKHGLSAAHAGAIVANMLAESGGDPSAVGDGGQARGAFQWHPDRQKLIKDQFGTDVGSMTRNQSLDAMIWELKKRGQYDAFVSQPNAFAAGSYISSKYEVAAGKYGPTAEAISRGNAAMRIASQSPFSAQSGGTSGGQTVNVDKMEIHTAAKDPQEIMKIAQEAFKTAARESHAQFSDSVEY